MTCLHEQSGAVCDMDMQGSGDLHLSAQAGNLRGGGIPSPLLHVSTCP